MTKEFDELLSFMQQKGFVWGPEPELYGGLSGFYTYAPLGKLLKNKVETRVRKFYNKNDFWEVECPLIMQKEVWKASGHLDGFSDPLIICSKCKSCFRVDNLIEELYPGEKPKDQIKFIEQKHIKCPNCKGELYKEIKKHDLMMKTNIGINIEAYIRPETATTTYLPFIRYNDFFRKKIPFGVFQIGKAFRNEISPRQHILRMREFTQAEAQLFLLQKQKSEYYGHKKIKDIKIKIWTDEEQEEHKKQIIISIEEAINKKIFKNKAYASMISQAYSLIKELGFPEEKIRLRQHLQDEKAFYADDAWDIEVNTKSFGWIELCGVHDRTDYDLRQHGNATNKNLVALDENNNKQIPHIIEIALGIDRTVFCLLDLFYEKKEKEEGKTVLKLPIHLAPIEVSVFPLVNKEGLPEIAYSIYTELKNEFICNYDDSGSIGKRYLREEETGTPLCVTIDFDTKEKNTVTIRERETGKQVSITVKELHQAIHKYYSGESIEKIGKLVKKEKI
ncbi:MAG: glycine--tRNA ligase [Candidatus Woesearchaeota archaeon]